MSDLKTLKDLNLNVDEYSDAEYIIKQEAIKDIKLFRAMKDSTGFQVKMAFDYKIIDIESVINYIKWKFNITEEDLK